MPTRSEAWMALKEKADGCTDCGLSFFAKQKVFCDPNQFTGKRPLVFIGEAPGEEENKTGVPFVGRAGQLLRENLERIGLDPSFFAIINTIQCRPPQNRNPTPSELSSCHPFLERKIRILDPSCLVTLGKFASEQVLGVISFSVTPNAGKVFKSLIRGPKGDLTLPTMAIPHPSWGLRGHQREFAQNVDKVGKWLKKQGIWG